MQGNIPPGARETVEELQSLQEQAQEVAVQKVEAEGELEEAQDAREILNQIDEEATMYKEVGSLLIETPYDETAEELDERIQELEVRVETLGKQEDRVESQFEDLQEDLREQLGDVGN